MFRCLSCGKVIGDYPNPVEHNIHKLKNADLVNRLVLTWEHHHICDPCKASILRQTADSIEYGEFVYGDRPSEQVYVH